MQPHPMTSVMQLALTAASICVAAAAIIYVAKSASEDRNARLVEIGVSVLTVDPKREIEVSGARKRALDLIDANAGGVYARG
jgi:CII-binding regulator of phage lambda lysogenization HflD